MQFPRLVIAALRGGSGKTLLSIGIIAAWKALGKTVAPFKKGPDYIDAGWLSLAAGRPCLNLDTFLIEADLVRRSFLIHTRPGDIALVEGNRGLFDGIDRSGTTSTAELAKLLDAPVVLCLDCTKSTRTMAAAVLGCMHFDPELQLKGVILNRVAGARHEEILRRSIEHHCGLPVLGAVPKLRSADFPERHMGLVPTAEHGRAAAAIAAAARIAREHLETESLLQTASAARPAVSASEAARSPAAELFPAGAAPGAAGRPRIGIVRDAAFQFYYPENIDALAAAGAETLFLSPLEDAPFPELDALYIGGGFPETQAERLSANVGFREKLKTLVEAGLPVYAECGGLMYLGRALVLGENTYPMAGVLPVVFGFSQRPQGHGYTVLRVERRNPFYPVGAELRGHEFHYSRILKWEGAARDLVFSLKKGTGIVGRKDGLCYKNVLAAYTHIHALGTPEWAPALVRSAGSYRLLKAGD